MAFGVQKIKLVLLVHNKIIYIKTPSDATEKKMWKYQESVANWTNIRLIYKVTSFPFKSSKQLEKINKGKISFIVVSENIKYLKRILTNKILNFIRENVNK